MALNLWKIGGMSTSYNPLPTGTGNKLNIGIGEYEISFKAKSDKGGKLRVVNEGAVELLVYSQLTSEMREFRYTFKNTRSYFLIHDYDAKGDIIIEDIQLVQKPLPKLTINGIDGFLSGKWNLHANARVLDDETLELNATESFIPIQLNIPNIIPNTEYSFSSGIVGNGYIYYAFRDSSDIQIGTTTSLSDGVETGSFKTPPNTKSMRFYFSNRRTGKFTFKRPMLNLGTTPAPYEKKKGERMVMPNVKGNLFDGRLVRSAYLSTSGALTSYSGDIASSEFVPLEPNKTYTLSTKENYGIRSINLYAYNQTQVRRVLGGENKLTFTTAPNEIFIRFDFNGINNLEVNAMLNEGTTPQPYTPYAVQVNKKPKRYVPKKNYADIETYLKSNYGTSYSDVVFDNRSSMRVVGHGASYLKGMPVPLKPNTQWTLKYSAYQEGSITGVYFRFKYTDGTYSNPSYTSDINRWVTLEGTSLAGKTVVSIEGIYGTGTTPTYIEKNTFQLEEGTTATPYEPYQLVLPRAKTGLQFDGVKDYLQLPSMTMDSIEIDCLIEKEQVLYAKLVDARTGLADGNVGAHSSNEGESAGTGVLSVSGFKRGVRTTVNVKFISSFTDDVTVFSSYAGVQRMKGILYKVTCYLNGNVVAQYDFENPLSIVGDKVLEVGAKNLIPSFEDARWNIHANADVLGKDVLRLEGTTLYLQSLIDVAIAGGKQYLFALNGVNQSGRMLHRSMDLQGNTVNGLEVAVQNTTGSKIVQYSVNASIVRVALDNNSTGTFDFIKPQLYELTGREATLMGKPTALNKGSKRTLYRKR